MSQSKNVQKDSFRVKQLQPPPKKKNKQNKTPHHQKSNKPHTKQKQTWVVKDEG